MKELLSLKSFQQILLWLFLLGIIIGVLLTLYFINPDKFKFYLIIPSIPALYFIGKGLYKNSNLFFTDLKSITTKS
ncbi:hypothetical protein [Flavobacterium sp. LS1P3]|jgi:hypothetical protein|uniref:hypothetical protein n=1 Tax=Flavobacterium sp. LS1P3 TaxID=3401720 RepID=UPI003AAF4EFC